MVSYLLFGLFLRHCPKMACFNIGPGAARSIRDGLIISERPEATLAESCEQR